DREKDTRRQDRKRMDNSIKDLKDARTFLSDKLKLFSKENARKGNHGHIEDSQCHEESYGSSSDLDPNKKAKTDSTFNALFDDYTTAVNAIKSIQENNESAHS
ncbi:11533_t:CDS:2, partial [Scutellospora calospora]